MQEITVEPRVKLTATKQRDHLMAFAADVRRGLGRTPKELSCRNFYDGRGSALFEKICELPEYYLTRAEREILTRHAREIASLFDGDVSVLELGSGSGVKTRILLDALLERGRMVRYAPIDISRSAIEASSRDLVESFETLEIDGFVGEYREGLRHFSRDETTSHLVLWLGSSIGNLHRSNAGRFLRDLREDLHPRDRLLLGVDLRKDRRVLESAYDDARGVTAEFNKNLLVRINRELDGDFDLDRFRHHARYLEDIGRVEMHLVSEVAQRVAIGRLDLEVAFEAGETIHTENSYKYSVEEIEELAAHAGLELVTRWLDEKGRFSASVLAPA